jgi:hypothetical protein
MKGSASFSRSTCHGQYDGTIQIDVKPAPAFLFVWNEAHVNGDESRIRECMVKAAKETLSKLGGRENYRIEVTFIEDRDGSSPPYAFQECMRLALIEAFGKSVETHT